MLYLVILIAIFLRVYRLGVPSIWVDEAFAFWEASQPLATLIKYLKFDAHPPLYYLLLNFWIKLVGSSLFQLRLLSSLFGVLTVITVYLICTDIFKSEKLALLSSFLCAINSVLIITVDTDVKMYSLFIFLTVFSTYFLMKALEDNDKKNWFFYFLFSLLNIYTHYYSFFFIFAQVIYVLSQTMHFKNWENPKWAKNLGKAQFFKIAFFYKFKYQLHFSGLFFNKERVKNFLLSLVLLFLFYIPWAYHFYWQFFKRAGAQLFPKFGFVVFYRILDSLFGNSNILGFWYILPLQVLILLVLIIGFVFLLKEEKYTLLLLTYLIIVILVPLIVTCTTSRHIFALRYLSVLFPFMLIFIARGILSLKKLGFFLIILMMAFNFLFLYNYYCDASYWKQNWKEAAEYLEKKVTSQDLIVIQCAYNVFPLNYYFKENKLRFYYDACGGLTYCFTEEYLKRGGPAQFGIDDYNENLLRKACSNYKRVWLVLNSDKLFDPEGRVFKWFLTKYDFVEGVKISGKQFTSDIRIGFFKKKEDFLKEGRNKKVW